ncbi:unnamed protein product [Strongylus vulgaris]|uniref:Uncharacterized protein n=1 Tax=Strongylus vulgaris TaxID=40348 RepID=A0A3P7IWZ7_STRVU|nr:unnamed protein product [Strongylus vulgaris]
MILAAVAEAVSSMRDTSVQRRFEKEVELTLAWEAEKMIVERFVGESSLTDLYDGTSTSAYGFRGSTSLYEDENEFTWSPSEEIEQNMGNRGPRVENQEGSEYPGESCSEVNQLALTEVVIIDAASTAPITCEQSMTPTEEKVLTFSGKENRFACATCGYQGNNRKALYRCFA